jgi:two-component system invasion response regulator UvrY
MRSAHLGWSAVRETLLKDLSHRIVADVSSPAEAVKEAGALHPDEALIALDPSANATSEVVERICAVSAGTKVVVLGSGEDVQKLPALLRAGAAGFLSWNELDEVNFPKALQAIESGLWVGTPAAIAELEPPEGGIAEESRPEQLTEREWAMVKGLAEGKKLEEIGQQLDRAPRTMLDVSKGLKQKTGGRTLYQALATALGWARRRGPE